VMGIELDVVVVHVSVVGELSEGHQWKGGCMFLF